MQPTLIEIVAALCALLLPSHFAVVDSYRPPACTWCAGNRGIEYVTPVGVPIVAAESGEVTFVGRVAGVMYVVVRTPNNVLVTHGKLGATHVRPGDRVVAGFRIGTSNGNLYIGVRKDGVYLDPNGCGVVGKSSQSLVPRAKLLPIHSWRP